MLFSISIGLVVDDSVHVLSKYIRAKKEGLTPEERSIFSGTGGLCDHNHHLSFGYRNLYPRFFQHHIFSERRPNAYPDHRNGLDTGSLFPTTFVS